MNKQEHTAIICLCVLAAFSDGAQDEVERAQIERIVKGFSEDHLDLASACQDVLGGRLSLAPIAAQLQTPSAKALAYEMAVCVCHADGVLKEPEERFLADLRQALQLDSAAMVPHHQAARDMVEQPLAGSLEEARSIQGRHSEEIVQKSRQVNVSELLPLVTQQ